MSDQYGGPYGGQQGGDRQPGEPQYGQPDQPQYGQPDQPQYGQPQYGQPQYGQPDQPQYGQPQYGQPEQPQYGQPQQPNYGPPQGDQQYPPPGGYATQQFHGQPGQSPQQNGNGKLIGLIAGALVVVGAIVAALVVFVFNGDDDKSDTASGTPSGRSSSSPSNDQSSSSDSDPSSDPVTPSSSATSDSTGSSGSTSGRRLVIPASIPGYQKAPGVNAQTLQDAIGKSLAGQGATSQQTNAFRNGAAGVFSKGSSGEVVIFVGLSLRDIPSLQSAVRSGGVESPLRSFLIGAAGGFGATGAAATSFDPGVRGGAMRCTPGRIEGEPAQICAWGDESAFALTVFGKTRMTLSQAAAETRDLREQIESE